MALSSFKFRSSQMELIKKLWFLVTLIEKSQNSGMTLGTFSSLSSNCGQTDGYTGCPDLPELTPRKETHCEKEEEKGCFRVKPIFHQALHNIFFISLYFKFLFLVKKKNNKPTCTFIPLASQIYVLTSTLSQNIYHSQNEEMVLLYYLWTNLLEWELTKLTEFPDTGCNTSYQLLMHGSGSVLWLIVLISTGH